MSLRARSPMKILEIHDRKPIDLLSFAYVKGRSSAHAPSPCPLPRWGRGRQGGCPCPVAQKNLPQKDPALAPGGGEEKGEGDDD
jgi:hypothetical protein